MTYLSRIRKRSPDIVRAAQYALPEMMTPTSWCAPKATLRVDDEPRCHVQVLT